MKKTKPSGKKKRVQDPHSRPSGTPLGNGMLVRVDRMGGESYEPWGVDTDVAHMSPQERQQFDREQAKRMEFDRKQDKFKK